MPSCQLPPRRRAAAGACAGPAPELVVTPRRPRTVMKALFGSDLAPDIAEAALAAGLTLVPKFARPMALRNTEA